MESLSQVYAGISAVLFDMDGVLNCNSPIHEAAWKEVVGQHFQIRIEDGDTRIHGGRAHEILSVLLQRPVSREEALPFHHHKETRYRELARGNLTPVLGLHTYLKWLKDHHIETALVTSGDRPNVDLVLESFGLQEHFRVQITGEMVVQGKPHPEPYLQALAQLNIPASQALVHEDAPAGIRSGKAAGCRVFALSTTAPEKELLEAGADRVFSTFQEMLAQVQKPVPSS